MALGGLLVLAVARMVIAAAGRFEMIMVGDVLVAVANAGTAALLHPPPALAGVPIAQERRCQRFLKPYRNTSAGGGRRVGVGRSAPDPDLEGRKVRARPTPPMTSMPLMKGMRILSVSESVLSRNLPPQRGAHIGSRTSARRRHAAQQPSRERESLQCDVLRDFLQTSGCPHGGSTFLLSGQARSGTFSGSRSQCTLWPAWLAVGETVI